MTDTWLPDAWRNASLAAPMGWYLAPDWQAVTWQTLHGRIGAWQALLDSHGGPESCWLLYSSDLLDFTAALIAIWERGDHALLPGDEQPDTLTALDAQTCARLGNVERGLLPGHPRPPLWGNISRRQLAVSLYTSGSTGTPQRIDKSFAQLGAELDTHARLWPLQGQLIISQVSHQHIYGLLFAVLRPLFERSPMMLTTCRYPEMLSTALQQLASASEKRTDIPGGAVLISAPPPLERLPDHLDWTSAPATLHRVHSSGAPLSASASRHAHRLLGAPIQEIYGSSETGGIGWRDQQDDSAWHPLPGVEIRTDDEGCLCLRSPFLPSQDWHYQADRIQATPGGRFRLLGRADRIAKVGGKRLSLTAMDRSLGNHPQVTQARTVTLPERDHRLGAIVKLTSDRLPWQRHARQALIESLRTHLAGSYPSTVIPRYWRFVGHWPTDTQGKLSSAVITRLFRDLDDARLPRWLGASSPDDDHCDIDLEVPERLTYLRGHFADNPVVPGVAIIQWVVDLAREFLAVTGRFQRLERIRFALSLLPGERARLSLDVATTTTGERLSFTLSGQRGQHASGKIVFAPEGRRHDG
ncbi:AMP-binding protein [Aidingimonas lacisalsi]|uniref:AMP-binding protein n=1 Tax=Aidingimonas lacisalsi TaxID=2604086 RepID=UPI0011D23CFB|nr:AMP-binding protein [Aidingimonas lacisalsi]